MKPVLPILGVPYLAVTAAAAKAQTRPEVALNHVYLVVDTATLSAIESSAFLANYFAGYRKESNQLAEGRRWTGVYLHGERTYVEFFPMGTMGGVGYSGVALSVERPRAIDSVITWLEHGTGRPVIREFKRGVREGRSFDWFYSVYVDHPRGDSLSAGAQLGDGESPRILPRRPARHDRRPP